MKLVFWLAVLGACARAFAADTTPVGYWTMDTGTLVNGTVLDESPDHLNGTVTGGVSVVPGIINQGYSFNGSGYIIFLPETLTDLTGNASVALWVKTNNNNSLQALVSRYAAGGAGTGYLLRMTPSGHAELVVGGNNTSAGLQLTLTDSKVINDGQWHHVAAVITIGQGASIYVDGVLSTTQSSNIQAVAGASPLLIGLNGWVPYGTYFNGTLDDTRIYNRALLASEVATLATPGSIVSPPPPGPSLSVSPATFLYSAVAGASNPPEQPTAISNVGGGTLNWTATANQSWITLSTTANGTTLTTLSGTGNQTIWIQASSSALPGGSYVGTISVSAPGATPSSQTINVSLIVVPPGSPSLSVSPLNLFYSATPGGSNPIAQTLALTNAGQGTLASWTAVANQPWITLSSTAGTGTQAITVGTNVTGLSTGTYSGSVTITAPGALPTSSQIVNVTLAIVAATSNSGGGQTLYNGIVLPQQWPPVGTASQAYSIPSYITSPPAVIPIDVGRQLFVDDFLIQQTTLARTQHQPVMYAGNPVLTPAGSDTAGLAMPFSNGAWYDPSDHLFKLWYYCGSGNMTCYAYSTDGRNWTKPSIPDALVPNTNQVLPNPANDSNVVWMDLQDPNPAHKFKAFAFQGPANMGVYFSGDGIHWTAQQTQYSINSLSDRTTLFWNPFRNVWVDSMRNQVLVPGTQNRAPYPADRVRYYAESPDLLSWNPSNFTNSFWTGADENDPAYTAGGALPQLYNLDAVAYESTLVGLFSWFHPGPADPGNDPGNAAGPALVELGVGFSRDGFNWVRPNRGGGPSNALIPASNVPGSWNMGNTQSTGGGFLVVGNELWFYFSGRNGPHGHETGGSTGLATLRRDGFYSMNAGATQGVLVTRPVKFTGKYLFANVKDPQGSLQAEILDANGNVISPFTAQNSIALSVDSTLQQVTWSGVSDLSSLIGQTVQFRFYLTNGELYSFWVSPNLNGASNGYVAAGGPGFTGVVDTVGSGVCRFIVSPGGQAFQAAGGDGTVKVLADPMCSWSVSSAPSWVTLTGTLSGSGNGTFGYHVAANSGPDRSSTMQVAGQPFNLEQEADSIAGLGFAGSIAHLAAEENWTTRFTLVNKGAAIAEARLSLFGDARDPSGNGPLTLPLAFPQHLAAGPILASSFDRTLAGNASLIVDTLGPQIPPVLVGSAQLAATGPLDGFAIFHHVATTQEAVLPLELRNAKSYLLAFDNTNSVVLGIAVANISAQPANIPVVIRDDAGVQIGTPGATISLAGNGHTSFGLSDLFPVTANLRGTIEFGTPAGGQINVLGIRTTPLGTATTLTTIPALADVGTNGGSIAHIATGNGWQTTFVLLNTGTNAAQVHLNFFADNGSPLPLPIAFPQSDGGVPSLMPSVDQTLLAGATLIVQSMAPSSDPAPTIGSAQLVTDGNVGGFVIFRYNSNGQEAVVPLESRNAGAYILAFDNTNGTATGVAINAISTQMVNIPVTVRDATGSPIATDTITLNANGHYAFTLGTDRYPGAANIRGTIQFDAPPGAQIGALGIRMPAGAAHTFTTLPALAK